MQKLASECSMIEIDLAAKKVLSSRSHPDLEKGISTQIEDLSSSPLRFGNESKIESFSERPDYSVLNLKEAEILSSRITQDNKQPDSPTNNMTDRFVQEGFNALEDVLLKFPTLENIISPKKEELSSKKWVINELHKLGLCENEIVQGIQYIDDVQKENSNKEELLKATIDVILTEQEQQLELTKRERKNTTEEENHKQSPKKDLSMTQVLEGISYMEGKDHQNRFSIDLEEENKKEKLEKTKVKVSGIKPANENNLFSCEICLETFAPFQTDSLLKCGHMFCWYCYKYYLNEKLDTNKVLNIPCPKEGCQEIFEDHHLEKYLNQYTYARYKTLKEAATLARNPNIRWCIRPGCPKYMIGKPNSKKVVCECGMQICFKCSNKYHSFWSCNSVVDKVYQKYAEAHNLQSCPQCQYKTEKNGGCDHITCVKCSYEWCWLCSLQYTKDHYENENPNKCIKLQKKKPKSPLEEKYEQLSSKIRQNPLLMLALPIIIIFLSAYLPVWLYEHHLRKRSEIKEIKDVKEVQVSKKMKVFLGFLGIILFPITCLVIFVLWVLKLTCLKSKK